MSRIVGLDIGGANLKAASLDGPAVSRSFDLWKNPTALASELRLLVRQLPSPQRLAVTMTGELCDCYATRRAGVQAIAEAVLEAFPSVPARIWTTDGLFVDPGTAHANSSTVASANWQALATFAGRHALPGPALLIDIGTTTADIIPLVDRVPVPVGRTDAQCLHSGELVYRGWRRTPLCALGGGAAELFATTLDICLLLGLIAENVADHDTADGRPASVAAARARVARMLGADVETLSQEESMSYTESLYHRLLADIDAGLTRVLAGLPDRPRQILLAGSGEFLGRRLMDQSGLTPVVEVLSLNHLLGSDRSTAACAYAVAVLNHEMEGAA